MQLRHTVALLSLIAVAGWCWVPPATADTAVITATDAGSGQMHVSADVTSESCSTGGYCGWFSFAVERHSSLPCREDDAYLIGVSKGLETAGTVDQEWNYEPFFPRLDKICVFIANGLGAHLAGEATISLPTGYGRQSTTAHNCSYFSSQERAEYYLELYPSDPSRLDADHDGVACEANKCPCGAEPIPPEPETRVAALPPPPLPPTPTKSSECLEAEAALSRQRELVRRARATLARVRYRPRAARTWRKILARRVNRLEQTEGRVETTCP